MGGGGGPRGLKRSGVDPPLSSSRACLHKAFIAFSVHCVFDIAILRRLSVLPPPLPDLGARDWGLLVLGITAGSRRRCTPSWGVASPCPVLACGAQGVLAVAGLARPHTFHLCSLGHGGEGGGEGVRGHSFWPLPPAPVCCVGPWR